MVTRASLSFSWSRPRQCWIVFHATIYSIGTKLLLFFFLFCTEIKSSPLFKFLTEFLHSNGTLNMFGVCFGKKRDLCCSLEILQHTKCDYRGASVILWLDLSWTLLQVLNSTCYHTQSCINKLHKELQLINKPQRMVPRIIWLQLWVDNPGIYHNYYSIIYSWKCYFGKPINIRGLEACSFTELQAFTWCSKYYPVLNSY